jgi:glutamate-1-semialdehyde 2,1-aminomutase
MKTSRDLQGDQASRALAARAAAVIPGGANSNFRLAGPRRFWVSSDGARIVDVDGNECVDFVLGMGAAILGYSPRELLERVAEAQQDLQCPAGQQLAEIELAEKITELVPSAELVRIGCTGSEMVQLGLRLARAATGRSVVAKFAGHYHGWLDNIFAGTVALPGRGQFDAVTQTAGQSSKALEDLVILPWNNIEMLREFLTERGPEVAALIMEPVLCNTGVIAPADGYLEAVRSLCDEHGIVLIFDEVITGFRLAPGGAQARLGIVPDLTVLGKALGAGFPVAALAGRADLMKLIGDGIVMHGGTYNANAMCLAAAQAALETLSDPERAVHVRLEDTTELLLRGLEQVSDEHGGKLSVQGVTGVVNTTFAPPTPVTDYLTYHASDLDKQSKFIQLMDEENVRITSRGTWFISAAHTETDVDTALAAAKIVLCRMGQ